jgi:hypothetical protein
MTATCSGGCSSVISGSNTIYTFISSGTFTRTS